MRFHRPQTERAAGLQWIPDADGNIDPKLSGFILDSEAVNKAAMREMEGKYRHMTNVPCQAHALANLMKVCCYLFALLKSLQLLYYVSCISRS